MALRAEQRQRSHATSQSVPMHRQQKNEAYSKAGSQYRGIIINEMQGLGWLVFPSPTIPPSHCPPPQIPIQSLFLLFAISIPPSSTSFSSSSIKNHKDWLSLPTYQIHCLICIMAYSISLSPREANSPLYRQFNYTTSLEKSCIHTRVQIWLYMWCASSTMNYLN